MASGMEKPKRNTFSELDEAQGYIKELEESIATKQQKIQELESAIHNFYDKAVGEKVKAPKY